MKLIRRQCLIDITFCFLGLGSNFFFCLTSCGCFMLLEDLIQSFLVIADHTFCFTVCTVQGMIIKILKFFLSSQCVSPPGHSYSFNPIDSFTKEVIKSGALPVP